MHILQGDLILHKRTLEPIKTVIYGLRRYDVDRAMALRESADEKAREDGYMSHKSKIYLVSAPRSRRALRADRAGCSCVPLGSFPWICGRPVCDVGGRA